MSSTTIVTTFSDLYTALLADMRSNTAGSSTTQLNLAKRYIDTAHKMLYVNRGEKFAWAERRATLTTHPEYDTGTIAVTVGSASITGTDTAWTTNNDYGQPNMRAGGKLLIGGDPSVIYRVLTVPGATSATISPTYVGDTDTEVEYVYFEDEYDLASDFLKPIDAQSFADNMPIRIVSRLDIRKHNPRNWIRSEGIQWAAIVEDPQSGNTTRIRRVRFSPPPSNAQVVAYTYVTNKTVIDSTGTPKVSFTADSDEPIMPLEYRDAILTAAKIPWYRDQKDDNRSQEAAQALAGLLQDILGDEDVGSRTARMVSPRAAYLARAKRPQHIDLRHDTGWFDSFRDKDW